MLRTLLTALVLALATPARAAGPVARAIARSEVSGTSGLDVAEVTLELPGSGRWTAHRTHLEHDAFGTTWIGEVSDAAGGRVTITHRRATTSGVAMIEGRTFELRSDLAGRLVATEVRTDALPPQEPTVLPGAPSVHKPDPVDWRALGLLPADVAPVMQDLLVLYTAAAARRYGAPVLEGMILGGVAAANAAYRDSGVGITLRLVGLQRSATVTEAPSGMIETLARVRSSAEVARLRDQYGADLVLLVNENDDWCGYAYIMYHASPAYADDAFAAVRSNCLSTESIAHEVGHLQGLMHDRETMADDGALPYGHGYRRCERGGFRDVMAYQCSDVDVPRLRLFSNPDRTYHGVPVGIAYETDPAHSADAARALNETAALVARYRASADATAPGAPVALTAYSQGRAARLAWRDLATDTRAFIVERADTGNFVEIARLGPRASAFRDGTVAPGRSYSYRVRASNGAGTSPASNAVTVTIAAGGAPALEPAAPHRTLRSGHSLLQRR